ncbi:dihydroorotate dehydrogenase [Anaerolineales bacterium]
MSISIPRGKYSLTLRSPVLPAAGTFGYGERYHLFINYQKLGAIVTNPVSYQERKPAEGTRVVEVPAGVLMHTGLPNAGVRTVIAQYRDFWQTMKMPVILHLIATNFDDVGAACELIDYEDSIQAIELGLPDDLTDEEAFRMVQHTHQHSQKPILVCLPLTDAYAIADAVADAGATALVIASAPRGTVRDPYSGKLVDGRIYSPLTKLISLRMVRELRQRLSGIPIIGAGGIHSFHDARDFIEAGALAVEVDSVTWIQPQILETIARDLGGWQVTRMSGAYDDEWNPNMGDTEFFQDFSGE